MEILDFSDTSELVLVSRFLGQGFIYDLKVKDSMVFLAWEGLGLSIINISDISNPQQIGFVEIKGFLPAIEFYKDKLFYATNSSIGLNMIDISNPSEPEIVKTYDGGSINKMIARDNYLYVSGGRKGMTIFEIMEDNSLLKVHGRDDFYSYDLEIRGNTMYVTTADSVLVIEISIPSVPQPLGAFKIDYSYKCRLYKNLIIGCGFSIKSIDISNLDQPLFINEINLGGVAAHNLIVKDDLVYVATDRLGLKIFSIDESGKLRFKKEHKTQSYAYAIAVKDETVFLAQSYQGILVFDVSNPSSPQMVSSIINENPTSLIIKDNYLLCSNYGLQIFDISNPHYLVEITYVDLNTKSHEIKIIGNMVYLASGTNGLIIFDVSDMYNPIKIGEYDTPGTAYGVDIKENLAYIADLDEGLRIVDITDPANMFELRFTKYFTPLYSVAVIGDYAYVGSSNFGIRILDISDPDTIPLVRDLNTSRGYNILVHDSLAYISAGYKGAFIYNVTDAGDPAEIAFYNSQGYVYDIALDDNTIYLADYKAGFCILGKCPEITVSSIYQNVSCFGQCDAVIEILNVENASQPVQYNWSNGQTVSTMQELCQSSYTVTISDNRNCTISQSFNITEPPAIQIYNINKFNMTNSNPKGSIELAVGGGTPGYSFSWAGPNGFTSGAKNLEGLEAGCYTLTVIDANGCSLVSDEICIEDKTSGLADYENKQDFRLSPNPAGSYLQLEILPAGFELQQFNIFDITGKHTFNTEYQIFNNENSKIIDISHLHSGFYYLQLKDKNNRILKNIKFIKME
jgi:hypothetical protein